ncbi:hypothetical protein [Pengzhenrongella frigida]|uniref:Uncharacterized protein n=1 Tax=Pengzhenrongella frigida TaxID=1259133 RepID=A0A4Q5N0N1_9MICO|nr:hypothetical protein [Cellulomonas sp. HLT2-17]RYV51712.1 hypothetical protein EUA98_07380 [Cellulomonas sp. HLT2-17]
MTTHVRAQHRHPSPPALPDARALPNARAAARPATTTEVAGAPKEPGFVLHVGVDESFGHGPQALRDLIEAAETLQELARDLLPKANTFTTLSLTPPAAD